MNISSNRPRLLIGIASLLLMLVGFWDMGIQGVEINPGAMHFLNGVLFLSLLYQLELKSHKIYGFIVIIAIMIIYEIVRHVATSYSPIGIYHLIFYILYSYVTIQVYKIIKDKNPKPKLSVYSITYSALGISSMLLGHRLLFGWEWF